MTHRLRCALPDVTNNAAIQKKGEATGKTQKQFFKLKKYYLCVFQNIPSPSRRRHNALCLAGKAEETKTTLCVISLKPNYNIYLCMLT